jgi:hypothetical protein
MTVGHVQTRKFKVNAVEPYNIYIEVEKKKIPSKTLNCLLGAWLPIDCGKISSVVNAEWTLTVDGQVTQRGSSTTSYIGQFDGKPGHTYQIDINHRIVYGIA